MVCVCACVYVCVVCACDSFGRQWGARFVGGPRRTPEGSPHAADSLPPVCVWYQLQKSAAVDERFYNEQQAPSRTPKSHFVLALNPKAESLNP